MSLVLCKDRSGWIGRVDVTLEDGQVITLEDACYENGGDWDYVDEKFEDWAEGDDPAVHPPGFKMVETTYKCREDLELVAKIKALMTHPKAHKWEGPDEDGDHVWRVWFLVSEADEDKVVL